MKARGKPGDRFGRLTLIERQGERWLARCDCGIEKSILTTNIYSGHTQSCGCLHHEVLTTKNAEQLRERAKNNIKDVSGRRFGRLVAVECVGRNDHRMAMWLVRCDCGEERIVQLGALMSSVVISCGCAKVERLKQRIEAHVAQKYPGVPRDQIKQAYANSLEGRAARKKAMQNYYAKNCAKIIAYAIARNGTESHKRSVQKYRQTVKGKMVSARACARRHGAITRGQVTAEQWMSLCEAYDGRCAYCDSRPSGIWPDVLQQDHLCALNSGGMHKIENIVPSCASCNSKKSALPIAAALDRLGVDCDAFWQKRDAAASREIVGNA